MAASLRSLSGPFAGAVGVIAVGVGLAAMVFALADPVFRRLPYADPDRLVSISFGLPKPGVRARAADVPSLASWQARTDLFDGVAAFLDQGWLSVRLSDRIVPLRAVAATDNLLEVLGVESRLTESDPAAAWVSSRVAALSSGELHSGRSVPMLPDGVLRVRGVLPPSFLLPQINRTDPVDALPALPIGPVIRIDGMSSQALDIVARVRRGVTPEMVQAALNVSMAPVGRPVSVVPLSTALNARLRGLATGALLTSGLVILVCWTNVLSMAMTRGLYRRSEIATRTALGATPGRIVGLLLREGLKVAAFASVGAVAVMWLTLLAVLVALPPEYATLGAPAATRRVVLFVVLVNIVAGASWFVGSLLAWKLDAKRQGLLAAGRDGRTIRMVRSVLIAGQLGAASVLLVASALLGRSYLNLLGVDSGMDDRTLTLTVVHDPNIPVGLRREVVDETLAALRRTGVVEAAGASAGGLLDGRGTWVSGVVTNGRVAIVDWTFVAGDYFQAMGLQFLAGGPPRSGSPDLIVVTESAARELFERPNPVGDIFAWDGRDLRVAGVVRDVRVRRLSLPPRPGIYRPSDGWFGQQPRTTYVLRVADTSAAVPSWERILHDLDPRAVVLDSGSVRARLDRSVRDRTFATLVFGLFALASVLVAALGIAGVVAYTVVKRTREVAIRLALGATGTDVTTLVVRDAVAAAACGIATGIIASVWLSSALESLLYGVDGADSLTLVVTAVGLLVCVLAAATLPGMRAGRIAPATALRME
jgi:predicted permease